MFILIFKSLMAKLYNLVSIWNRVLEFQTQNLPSEE